MEDAKEVAQDVKEVMEDVKEVIVAENVITQGDPPMIVYENQAQTGS